MLTLLHQALPESDLVYLALRDRFKLKELLIPNKVIQTSDDQITIHSEHGPMPIQVLFDEDLAQRDYGEIGPAKGLLRAHENSRNCPWLVVACDYPYLCVDAPSQLLQQYLDSLTVFRNLDGFSEPLLGIWPAEALNALGTAVAEGITGPSSVVRKLNGHLVRPESDKWLKNVNNSEESERVVKEY